jgi:hypothetical protein
VNRYANYLLFLKKFCALFREWNVKINNMGKREESLWLFSLANDGGQQAEQPLVAK